MSTIAAVTDSTFENEVMNSKTPVLVDFWAEWCGPCKMLMPVIDEVSAEYAEKVKFLKINVDDNPETAPKFGVRGIPTLILFKDGQVLATKVGSMTKSQLVAFIDSHI
ncbi:MAG: thioredoxin TrxA [Gammaproteobacteria bacterium]